MATAPLPTATPAVLRSWKIVSPPLFDSYAELRETNTRRCGFAGSLRLSSIGGTNGRLDGWPGATGASTGFAPHGIGPGHLKFNANPLQLCFMFAALNEQRCGPPKY